MYKFNKELHRINWIYSEYADMNLFNLEEFLSSVNESYYSNSANMYSSRFIKDIYAEYQNLFNRLDININDRYIVDIGGGTGFEYDLFKHFSINFKHFKYIEPSIDMISIFKDRIGNDIDKNLSFYNGYFSEVASQIGKEQNKLLVLNSALHHVVWLEPMLDDIKSSMNSGDIFILGHEPNNSYSKLFLFIQKLAKVLLTSVIFKKIFSTFKTSNVDSDRWDAINKDLINKKVIVKKMSPLLIRRIIDYGVGYKNDWKKLSIPDKYNEGFWTIDDLSSYLGSDFKLLHMNTYRHLGDPNGNLVLEFLNNIFSAIFKKSGSNFIAVWEKKNK